MFNFSLFEIIIFLIYFIISYILWELFLKKDRAKANSYISKANNSFTMFMFILPLIIYINNVHFEQITLRQIIMVYYAVALFIYLFYLFFYKGNTKE